MAKYLKIICLSIFLPVVIIAQNSNFIFDYLTVEQGLSDNGASFIVQDHQGFIWIGTEDGLNRYDGYSFKIYRHDPEDENSLSDNLIWYLTVDKLGTLWIGTLWGLDRYDQINDQFIRYRHDPDNQNSLFGNEISYINDDRAGNLYVCTDQGVNIFDRQTEQFTHIIHDPLNSNSLSSNKTSCLVEDQYGYLWIGTRSAGLDKYDRVNQQFFHYRYDPKDPTSISQDQIDAIYEDTEGTLWIATIDAGLNKYDRKSDRFKRIQANPSDPASISFNALHDIFEDRQERFWIATRRGLNLFDRKTEKVTYQYNDKMSFTDIFEDNFGTIWCGTATAGVAKLNIEKKQFPNTVANIYIGGMIGYRSGIFLFGGGKELIRYELNGDMKIYPIKPGERFNPVAKDPDQIQSFCKDREGIFWIGTWYKLYTFNPRTEQFKRVPSSNLNSILQNIRNSGVATEQGILSILTDESGRVWMGTNIGVICFEKSTGKVTHFQNNPNNPGSLSSNVVQHLYIDSHGLLWIATRDGLNCLDPVKETIKRFYHIPKDSTSINHNDIKAICESKYSDEPCLWVGTVAGINKFNRYDNTFKFVTPNDGSFIRNICGILEDYQGNLWISITEGLIKYNPRDGSTKRFNKDDGLQPGRFKPNVCVYHDGLMFFGGNEGFTCFHPDSIKDNISLPPIVITSFKRFNKEVRLDTAITQIRRICLSHEDKVIAFEFAALDFTNPGKNQYAYKLEGFDEEWLYSGNKHDVTYTNLSPGNYVFRVKGTNHDGIWNEKGTTLRIIVTPPWWRTTWSYLIYVIILLILLYSLRKYDLKRQHLKHQLALEHEYSANLQKIDHMKSRFFANISHEFRTPLTLILGPIKKWLPQLRDRDLKQDLQMMQRNANRLFRLINQLLDLSRLESGGMTLQVREERIAQLLRGYVQSFESLAKIKKINLDFVVEDESISVYADRDKIEKIMNNLLSNAFKFTPERGKVCVAIKHPPQSPPPVGESSTFTKGKKVSSPLLRGETGGCKEKNSQFRIPNSDFVEIIVTNSGSYIPPEKTAHIFDRFYQADDSTIRGHEGSGIGLALTKELVELHHGQITVESKIDKGTTFIVSLPLGQGHLNELEIINSAPPSSYKFEDELLYETVEAGNVRPKARKKSPLIMIIEDNPDVRFYIRGHLESSFRIIEAGEGKEGLKLAIKKIPDLIISDVMMPGMDGFEVCQKIKTDERTSHIPFILLTAKATTEDKIDGLQTGADDYLTKPFDADELRVRINNLITQREKLRNHYLKTQQLVSDNVGVTPADKVFISKINSITDAHLAEPDYSIASLARDVGFSHSQLIRKLESLTGLTPSLFIRTRRLLHAKLLLDQKVGNISQVAYDCGFNNLSYFSRSFRSQFGQLPSEYIKDPH